MLSKQNEAHAHILMDHQAPYCRSTQLFKSVLNQSVDPALKEKF